MEVRLRLDPALRDDRDIITALKDCKKYGYNTKTSMVKAALREFCNDSREEKISDLKALFNK